MYLNKDVNIRHPQGISRRTFLKLFGLTTTSLALGCTPDKQADTALALINGTLIDGTGSDAVADAVVVILDKRIVAAGSRYQVEIPTGAEMLDLRGGAILPGFVNAHVHDAYDEDMLKAWAQGGVTTVRDLGAFESDFTKLFAKRNTLRAIPECARLIAVGLFINAEGGYPITPWGGVAVTVASPDEAREAVNLLVDVGADVIKTAFESGYTFGQSGWPLLSPQQATALVEEAHRRGKTVTAHVTDARDLGRALDAGVDEIAHMVVNELPDDLIARMVESGTRWVPTLELWQGVSRNSSVNYGTVAIDNLGRFVAAGGEVALGSDYAGAQGIDFDLGMPIHEIKWMQDAGMTPMQIIVAATRNGARSCDREDDLGTLEAGKMADILVVGGNPLDDIQNLKNTQLVLREGKVI